MKQKKLIYFLIVTAIFINVGDASAQLKVWGRNDYGQTGIENLNDQPAPITVQLSDVTGIGGGYYHTLFLRADGTVLASGFNLYGQLGDGTRGQIENFVQVSGVRNAAQVAGGGFHSLALMTDGTVRSWGYNLNGQLGNDSTNDTLSPVTVTNLDNVVAVAAGLEHSLALKSDGTVWAWGDNSNGQLGDNSQIQRRVPVQVLSAPNMPLNKIIAVSAGEYHSLALKSDGTVFVWGSNNQGQLGNSSTAPANNLTAVQNTTLTNVVQIAAGAFHNVALKNDGSVFVWGRNTEGEAGNGSSGANGVIFQLTPVQSQISGNISDVRADGFHTLARKNDGSIFAWGSNLYGQIGSGSSDTSGCSCKATPIQSAVGAGNAVFGAGSFHSIVVNPQIATNVGTNVNFQGDNIKIAFSSVTVAGMTDYSVINPANINLTAPLGWQIAQNLPAYELKTTAVTLGLSQICLNVPNVSDANQFARLGLMHGEGNQLIDRTWSKNYQTRQICAQTDSLSIFAVGIAPSPKKKTRSRLTF